MEDDPSILLNAITGLTSTNMIQLAVRVAGDTVGTLIDSGSTHSFISASVTAHLHLEPLHQPGHPVKVANSAGIYKATHIYIDDEEFVVDLFIIPLEGFDMVLGV
jgi:hypothetical protein